VSKKRCDFTEIKTYRQVVEMVPFNKETMMMIALAAVIIGALYMYKDLQLTKKELGALKKPVLSAPVPVARKKAPEVEVEELKSSNTVADEQ
jgi:hypothetical protein